MKTKLELFLEKTGLTNEFKENLDYDWDEFNNTDGNSEIAISIGFDWEESKQKSRFWGDVHMRYRDFFNSYDSIVNNPTHYNKYSKEVIDMMVDVFGVDKVISFCEVNAFKYRMRAGLKGDVDTDLKNESWYLDKAEELKNK